MVCVKVLGCKKKYYRKGYPVSGEKQKRKRKGKRVSVSGKEKEREKKKEKRKREYQKAHPERGTGDAGP
jgi:hypothetical protein